MVYPYKLSIITVNLNNKDGLQKTIDSVINQTYQDFEWLIIDGGSTDGSKELIEKYKDRIDYWVSEPDKGIYNAMNKGILASSGEYLLFLNSGDTLYENDTIFKTYYFLKDHDIYVGNIIAPVGIMNPSIYPMDLLNMIINSALPHQSSFIKRDLFTTFGCYNEDYRIISDWLFFFNAIVLKNCSIAKIPFIISKMQPNGISVSDYITNQIERNSILNKYRLIKESADYYNHHREIILALKDNKVIFFLFRIYFYFFRKLKRKELYGKK